MERAAAIEQYRTALRNGQKYCNACISRGQFPYPQVLEDLYPEAMTAARAELGVMEIPMDAIIGTLASGRKSAFAGNFMPLLNENTEFAAKWINLCSAHLSDRGIVDPIVCFEYLGRFYVQEGHKRVSVLRSYDALTIRAKVTRVYPIWNDEPNIRAYYEFLEFFKRAQIYGPMFTRPGCWAKLEEGLGFEKGHVWTGDERADFMRLYWRLREACTPQMLEQVPEHSLSEVLLSCLDVYPYEQLKTLDTAELRRRATALLPDLRYAAKEETKGELPTVSTEPAIPGKTLVGRILDGIARPTLNVAFVHVNDPATSAWTQGHDEGARQMEEALGSQVRVKTYIVGEEDADTLMGRAVAEDGAQLLIATAPTLLAPARQAAALHPSLKVLVCALSVPYVGVRTYYSRIHEAKFISGAIAGALCGSDPIGYIARYPILGVPASINSFALGVRMTNPKAQILLEWSGMDVDPVQKLWAAGARIISGHPVAASTPSNIGPGWSTALMEKDGSFLPLAVDIWNWGRTYEQIVRSVLAGAWDTAAPRDTAVSYWWGLSSGVIDVRLSDTVPQGVRQLAGILKEGIIRGTVDPFQGVVLDQGKRVRSTQDSWFQPEELMRMNWLCDNVIGHIPTVDELLPMARETTRLLALPEDVPQPAPAN